MKKLFAWFTTISVKSEVIERRAEEREIHQRIAADMHECNRLIRQIEKNLAALPA